MLRTRVISAVVLLAIIAVPFFLGGWPFLLLIVAAGVLGAWEYTSLFRQGWLPAVNLALYPPNRSLYP